MHLEIRQKNILWYKDLENIIKKIYKLPYGIQQSEFGQNTYIDVDNVNGEYKRVQGFWTRQETQSNGMKDYSHAKYVELKTYDQIIEHWSKHSGANEGFWSAIDDKGEDREWFPDEDWILNDLFLKGIVPSGDYLITIWW